MIDEHIFRENMPYPQNLTKLKVCGGKTILHAFKRVLHIYYCAFNRDCLFIPFDSCISTDILSKISQIPTESQYGKGKISNPGEEKEIQS